MSIGKAQGEMSIVTTDQKVIDAANIFETAVITFDLAKKQGTFVDKTILEIALTSVKTEKEMRNVQIDTDEAKVDYKNQWVTLAGEEVSLLCTSGQIKTASFILIDLLCEAGCRIFYSGDFAPEGLNIADKILGRNQNCIVPWRLKREDYVYAVSNETISDERLIKLKKVKDRRLFGVCDAILCVKKAGYQERLVEQMLADIRKTNRAEGSNTEVLAEMTCH